ncbi:MAG TPA: TIM barrel protein, partial [Deinococcales bacterium]|nr:TIM barrel protein [Deinococcales bacterium]
MPQVGLQLYTLRREAAADFTGTLEQVAAAGYQGVEFAGYGGLEAPALAKVLAGLNLTAVSSHVGFDRLSTSLDQELDFLGQLGATQIVCPWLPEALRATEKAWLDVADRLAEIGERCAARGFALAYHNHSFEFTSQVNGAPAFDALFGRA